MRRVLPLLILLATAAPAQAHSVDRHTRASATKALERAQRLAEGRGVRSGREFSPALQQLVAQRSDLSTEQRRQADRLLLRPTDPTDTGPGGPYSPAATVRNDCTNARFCIHWVETTSDAIDNTDTSPANGKPDYVDDMIASFQTSFDVENTQLGWIAPKSDGSLGGNSKTDVYIKDVGDEGIYGYASTDPGQGSTNRNRFAYLVMDNDYDPLQFPGYTDPLAPMQVTAAHEYNHVLQYAYDTFQDTWMFESTATWSEDKVFDAVDDYVFYLDSWAKEPDEPITSPGDGSFIPTPDDDLKMYGSAIWNHWIDAIYGPQVVRRAWEVSIANTVAGGGFAPRAYDAAIKEAGGPGFASELGTFSVATAFWETANSGIHEGASFGTSVTRSGTLTAGGAGVSGFLDHTAFALYDVPVPSGASQLNLTGGLPAGTSGAIALVGSDGTNQNRAVSLLDGDGRVTVSLSDPGRFSRITAVVVNTDTSNAGFDASDWAWTRDAQPFTLSATTGAVPVDPTPTPTAPPTVTPPPPPPPSPPPATSLRLSRNSTKIGPVARKGVLSLFMRTNKAGRATAKATVDRATALRLRVGRRTTTAGTGGRTATAAARLKVNVKLTKKLRAALKRQKRALTIKVQVTFVPTDGTSTVRRTIAIRLRR